MTPLDFSPIAHLAQDVAPLLPDPAYLPWLGQVGWALVVAAVLLGGLGLQRPKVSKARVFMAASFALWTFYPGPWGLSYWLGLAFQKPSLMACALALHFVVGYFGKREPSHSSTLYSMHADASGAAATGPVFLAGALALGWILLIDTFGVLPFSVYAWGFHPVCSAALLACALWAWVRSGRWHHVSGAMPALLLLVLLVFWFSRWPSGNVWDAVLDPCLWIVLHSVAIRRFVQSRRG